MKIAGIIAEYNPFHNGHAYHIQQTRELTGADYVVVVQSGNFVQRGAPAIVDKYCRTRMALLNGADLVLELPTAYACASAEGFASGAVSLLQGLGCVDILSFGSEQGNLALLDSYARVLTEEPSAYQELLRAFLKQGLSFPLARSKALQEYFSYGQDILPCSLYDQDCRYESEILNQPNNTLGIEYLKALRLLDSNITPFTIKRRSSGYHETTLDAEFASATALRQALLSNAAAFSPVIQTHMPDKSGTCLADYLKEKLPLTQDDFSSMLYYQLLSKSEEALAAYTDMTPELANRIKKQLTTYQTFSTFADSLKTKQLTHTRITRALFHVLLQDYQSDADARKAADFPSYARILGFRRDSQPLLGKIKQTASIPLIAKAADGERIIKDFEGNTDRELLLSMFRQDLFAAHLYESAAAFKSKTAICHEFTRQMTVV